MKFLFDLFPVILFFAAYKLADIYVATGVAIIATMGQIAWMGFRHRKVEQMHWVSFGIILVFGGATLLLQDETFIKWKPTVLYWLFAATLLIAAHVFRKNLIRALMEKQIALPEPVWSTVNASWAAFFVLMGGLNLYVAYSYSTDIWVDFKLFGGTGLMLAFVLGQAFLLAKYVEAEDSDR